ncbi:MAG TPA: glycosyltransferase, partial [Fodinibius sp.]|nr:glycosyltransferase [Fodinibius sp.]
MAVLLYIALGYLFLTTAILLLNKNDFQLLDNIPDSYFDRQAPSVSICIPARNEAACIERCVRSSVTQDYPNSHVYVLDDGSTDGTVEIITRLKDEFADQLTVITGRPKPADWLGKPWAC